jgi:hypothetical protein
MMLLGLEERHTTAIHADFRRHYSQAFTPGTRELSWGEAWHLTKALLANPDSQLQAELHNWQRPISHIELTLFDLYDVIVAANSKHGRAKPHPRPWNTTIRHTKPQPNTNAREILAQTAPTQ